MTTHEPDGEPGQHRSRPGWLLPAGLALVALVLVVILARLAARPGPRASANEAAPLNAATGGPDIPLAILAPLSGVAPGFGVATRDGALLAVNQWNARGGVLGAKIRPIVIDSQCQPEPAGAAAHTAIDQDHVHYIVGEVCSGASVAVSQIANQSGVVQISPTSTEPGVTTDEAGKTKDYVFRACFIDPYQGTAAAGFARRSLRARTAVIFSNGSDSYSTGLADYFARSFAADGGQILARENYTSQQTDFSAALARVTALKPDVVYLPDDYKAANLVTKQARQQGITVPFLGGDGWDSPDLDVQAAAGSYFTTHFSQDDPRGAVRNFVKEYTSAYPGKTPDALAALAYDATNLMLEAIKEAGVDNPARVKDALAKIQFDAVTGRIAFDEQHNPRKPATVMAVTPRGVAFREVVNP